MQDPVEIQPKLARMDLLADHPPTSVDELVARVTEPMITGLTAHRSEL